MGTPSPDPTSPLHHEFKGFIHEAFQAQAASTPKKPALVSTDQVCSYAELDEISDRIAGLLQTQGIGKGKAVGLLSDRSPALVYGMLGVLKAGAAFFVADAAYPPARIREFLEIVRPGALLMCGNTAQHEGLLADGNSPLRHAVSANKTECLSQFPIMSSSQALDSSDDVDAYYAFTSGSTGQPKVVVTTHAPLLHFLGWHVQTHSLSSADRFSMLSGLGHDPVFRDIFTPLLLGAPLYVPEQQIVFDPYRLSDWLRATRISIVHLTPALGQIILAGSRSANDLAAIRYFFWGGDSLGSRLSRDLRAVASEAKQVNFYGATETPQAMSSFFISKDDQRETYPLGQGIADVQLLILNPLNQLAQVGEVGEIFIRTPYLSRGYLNDPEKTSAAFVPNPFTQVAADRCYKTGDLGYYLEDGNVAFAGRSDHQVKIRGYRVELDEVRAKIENVQGVERALVLAQDLGRASKVLAAYYSCRADMDVESAHVEKVLRDLVPSYMAPSYYIKLASFPLLPNGKIDLRALPAPSPGAGTDVDSDQSLSGRENQLAKIWGSLLGMKRVGVNESFLELGGDSLSIIGVLVRMRQLGIPDEVARGVVQGKTIAEIVREERGDKPSDQRSELSGPARTVLVVNCLRALLVSVVVAAHWLPGLLKRLPASFDFVQTLMDPFFNLATPGFAVVFGITLGFYYFPQYATHRQRVHRRLMFGLCLLGVSLLVDAALRVSITAVQGQPVTADELWTSLFGSLLYYFLALATAPLWFRLIACFRHEYLSCLGLLVLFYAAHRGFELLLLNREQSGFLQLCRLMLVAKFAYFNMSIGALGGMSLGIYLQRHPENSRLAQKLLIGGVSLCVCGLVLLRAERDDFAALADGNDMGLWRWFVYGGTVLLLASCLTTSANLYGHLPSAIRTFLNLLAILGQISLLVYVLHSVVLQAKFLLVAAGLPGVVSLTLPMIAFLGICMTVMSRLYRIYYGRLGR